MRGMLESCEESTGYILRKCFHLRHDNKLCKNVWRPLCHRSHAYDILDLKNRVNEGGFECIQEKDKGQFQLTRPRDSLFTSIQCDMCIFPFLTGRKGTATKKNEVLQIFIERLNLESFWDIDSLIIYGG